MKRASKCMQTACALAALLLVSHPCGAAGAPAPLKMHKAPRPPVASKLPPQRFVGDAATRLQRAYGGTPIDVRTYHYTNLRTGWNPSETDLTTATVRSAKFGLLATLSVDGNVFAQPLLVTKLPFPDQSLHDVLIVVTGHDSVYAYDARTYALLWRVSLGTAASTADVGCYDVNPEYGIDSTPVILRPSPKQATLYVVAATEPSPGIFQSTLHALDVATGRDVMAPAVIAPSATLSDGSTLNFDPQNQWVRAGLASDDASIYVAVGSHCDHNSSGISGWLLHYSASLVPQGAFHTVESAGGQELASIWMTGFAPAILHDGSVLVATGNGHTSPSGADWGESVLRLNAGLSHVETWYTDPAYHRYNYFDTDVGSGGVMALPASAGKPEMAVQTGKSSTLLLLDVKSLGKIGHPLQAQYDGGGGVWGGPAYYEGPDGPTVFTQSGGSVLRSWQVNGGHSPSLVPALTGTSYSGYGGSLPIVSSNAATPGTGIVWLINRAASPFALEAYDASELGDPIFTSQIGTWSSPGNGNPFLTPMEANGRVYAPGYLVVQVFGLTP